MATIVNKTIWTNADWTPIVRKARMMAIPKEWDRATEVLKGEAYNPKIAWSRDFEVARKMAVAEWAKPDSFWKQWGYDYRYVQWQNADNIDIYKVEADKFKPVGYQNNGNKVYKNSKGQQFSLDSNGDAYIVKEKALTSIPENNTILNATSTTDLATAYSDRPEDRAKVSQMITGQIQWINKQYQSKYPEQFMTPMQKYPSYQELSKPMFDNTNLNAPIQNTSVPIQNISEKEKNKKINNSWKEMKQLDNYLRKTHAWPVDYIGKSNAYGEWNITKWWFSKLMDEWN